MNSWLLLRRLRGPAFLILVGVTALLNQWGILGFGRSWPLYLILAGIFALAEQAVLAGPPPPPPVYPASTYPPGGWGPVAGYGSQPATSSSTPTFDPADRGIPADPIADPERRL